MSSHALIHDSPSAPDYGTLQEPPIGGSQLEDDDVKGYTVVTSVLKRITACQIVVLVLAGLLMVLGIAMLAGGYTGLLSFAMHRQLEIRDASTAYTIWKKTPMPLQLKIYVFNLTNAEEFKSGAKPVLQECGPYVWREYHEKRNLTFHPNYTVTYYQQRWWVWDQVASGNRSQDDVITTLNTIPVATAYSLGDSFFLATMNIAFEMVKEQLTVNTTVRKVVFDGVEDPLLDWVQKNVVAKDGPFHFMLSFLEKKGGAITQFEKFAWFYKRNLSLTYDGLFNMRTGEDTLENLGKIDLWNNARNTTFYTPPCNNVTGSAGELFPPNLSKEKIVFFSSDLCMSASLFYKEEVSDYGGLIANRYWATNHTFANGSVVPGNECYCVKKTCAPTGLLNAESCRMGAPAFVSFPHFYAADPFLLKGVDGLHPDEAKHAFFMDIVPEVGVPTTVNVRLQINIRVRPVRSVKLLKNAPDVYLPMLWFEVHAEMTPQIASDMRMLKYFLDSSVPHVVVWSVLIAVAVLVMLLVLVLVLRRTGTYELMSS